MRSKHFLGLGLVVGGIAAAGIATTGCSGDTATGGSGGAGSTSASQSSSHASSSRSSSSTSGPTSTSGTGGGASNATCDTAIDLKLDGKNVPGKLTKPDTDTRWYKFTGKKGDPMAILSGAKTGTDKFDPKYLDTNVTLYNDCKTQKQIAQNDDPFPRSTNDGELFTILPADGTYYVRVAECNAVFPPANCSKSSMIKVTDFTILAVKLDPAQKFAAAEGMEPNDAIATATDITAKYDPTKNVGQYFLTNIYGFFNTLTDVDVYQFSLPADLDVDTMIQRSLANFYPQASTSANNGASQPAGKLMVVDPNDPMKAIAAIDVATGDELDREISVPLAVGKPYYLFVQRPVGGAVSPSNFYFIDHGGSGSNPIETADAKNTDITTPEVLNEEANEPGSFFVDGDISVATDVDYYSLTIPAGKTKVSVACGGQRLGSGVRGLTWELLKDSAGNGSVSKITEDPMQDVLISGVAVPAGETKLILKMSTTASPPQDPMVTSTFYRCGIHFT